MSYTRRQPKMSLSSDGLGAVGLRDDDHCFLNY
jgi:hypothetical protein